MNKRIVVAGLMVAGLTVCQAGLAAEDGAAKWDHSLSAGVNLSEGNSKTLTTSAGYIGERKGSPNEMKFTAGANYGRNEVEQADGSKEDNTNIQNYSGAAVYRRLLDEMNYVSAHVDASSDKIADVTYRIMAGPAVGRYFLKDDADTLRAEIGVDYITDEVADVSDDRFALRIGQEYTHKFATAKVWESVTYLPALDDFGVYLLNAELGAEAAMTEGVSLRVVLQDKYNSEPAAGKKNNDLLLTAGLLWKM